MKKDFKRFSKKIASILFVFSIAFCFLGALTVKATSYAVTTTLINVRSGPGTTYTSLGTLTSGTSISISNTVNAFNGCLSGSWFEFTYNGSTGYACSSYFDTTNKYNRPWTTPKKSIVGGAIYKAENYISKGQFTSYLIKFNVNPAATNSVYTHQYMTNVRAVSFESTTSYHAYLDNNLLNQPLIFTIPLYNNMPADPAPYPEESSKIDGQDTVTDTAFEALLDAQGFPESYKKKLRVLHNSYPNWIFEALNTGLDFNASVTAEQPNSYVDGTNVALRETYADAIADGVYCKAVGTYCLKEASNWYLANTQTTAYYLDPRNFLWIEKILMFEKLSFSDFYTEAVVQSSIDSTFMAGTSTLDSQTYASIFVEAGRTANISPIYLTSQAIQEVGTNGSGATSGAAFTYNGVTYQGLYNFFNIGAYSSAPNPVVAGLMWANGGATSTIVTGGDTTVTTELTYLNKYGLTKTNGYVTGVPLNQTISSIKSLITDATVTMTITDPNGATMADSANLTTGDKVIITNGTDTYTNTIVIYGDISGDGDINAIDLLYMRKHLLNTYNLTGANLQAAKIAKNSDVGAADLLYLRKYLLDSNTYKITQ